MDFDCTGGCKAMQFDTVSQNESQYINNYEESNASIWNTTGGNKDVPSGEGVPEISK